MVGFFCGFGVSCDAAAAARSPCNAATNWRVSSKKFFPQNYATKLVNSLNDVLIIELGHLLTCQDITFTLHVFDTILFLSMTSL